MKKGHRDRTEPARGWGKGRKGKLFSGYGVSVWENERRSRDA